jgi:hypothetical protein
VNRFQTLASPQKPPQQNFTLDSSINETNPGCLAKRAQP